VWHIGSKEGAPYFAGANELAGGNMLPVPLERADKLVNHIVYDTRHGEMFLRPSNTSLLAWNGAWANATSPTNSGPIAYDVHRDRLVTVSPTHVWERAGGVWQQIVAMGAAGTIDAIVYDVAQRRTILVGGSTWAWNGSSATLLGESPVPPSQVSADRPQRRAVYDAARGTVVLFNGTGVWELVNDAWVPSFGPPASTQYHAHYDPNRRALWFVDHPLVSGGTLPVIESTSIGAWELRDNAWTRRHIDALANLGGTTMYDPLRARLIGFGAAPHGEVWSLQLAAPGEDDDKCRAATDDDGDGLAGCADPDCWPYCTPSCPPGAACPAGEPGCGDSACDPLESAALCPADC
jgi:hypothetical protein